MHAGKRRFLTLFIAAGLNLPGLGLAADASAALDAANERARQMIRQTMQERRIPGLQIAVVRGGQVVLSESLGLANVENRVPTRATTLFPLNSATKPFTGVAMQQLAESGRVDLDAPLARYLDGLPPAWRSVRVRQLLAHTSGLPEITGSAGLIGGMVGGGLQTTAEEVARWIVALTSGRLIASQRLRRMWTPEPLASGADGDRAAGWPVLQTAPGLQLAGIGGARAAFIVYPDAGLAVVVLTKLVGANPQQFIPRIAALYR